MTDRPGPDWLAELQARFGEVLRTPLDRRTGTLRAPTEAYPAGAVREVVDRPDARAVDRLAVYNRQYWFRLFGAVQTAFPRTARLLGDWELNAHAERFLLAHPPRGWDLERVPDGFDGFLAGSLNGGAGRDVVLEAARIDAAFRSVLRAAAAVPFRPGAEDAAHLLDARLEPSPATAVVVEHWPLIELAPLPAAESPASSDGPGASLPRLPEPRHWAIVRETEGIRRYSLEPREAELLHLLGEHSVRDALARLETTCPRTERAGLPDRARRWLARGAERGMWRGVGTP